MLQSSNKFIVYYFFINVNIFFRRIKMKYSIGLDIGTASVGWACINEDNKLMTYQGKNAWGVREFESAQTAETTRLKRGARRRYNRRKKRIQLVQQLFEPHMPKGFLSENNQSHFWRNSNTFENRSLSELLRATRQNTKRFPTMYHLREALIETNERMDLRFIYLAVHNLVKYRGHFLTNGSFADTKDAKDISEQLHELVQLFQQLNEGLIDVKDEQLDYTKIIAILSNQKWTRSDKAKEIGRSASKGYKELWKLLAGLNANASTLFGGSDNTDVYKADKLGLVLGSEKLEEDRHKLTENENEFLDRAYSIFSYFMLQDILQGKEYVAAAKVAQYNQYKEDVVQLKKWVNDTNDEKLYRALFISSKKCLNQYKMKPTDENLKKLCFLDQYQINRKSKVAEDQQRAFKKLIENSSLSNKEELITQFKEQQFLARLKGTNNAAIPYQNSVYEVQRLLRNQQKHFEFITEAFIEKIVQIISFRIPYYIGPLSKNENDRFSWIVRGEENITPATFEAIVDDSKSAEAFIKRMTNKCTYIKNEDVLCKSSLLYEKFEVFNELNVIQIRPSTAAKNSNYRLTKEMKCCLWEYGFKKYKTMTHKRVLSVLKEHGFEEQVMNHDESYNVYGTQKEDRFVSNLNSYLTFSKLYEEEAVDFIEEDVEQIIEWLTIFEEKSILKKRIHEFFPNYPSTLIEKLCKVQCTGWGALSRKLLQDIVVKNNNHTDKTIIQLMEERTLNFNEILSPQHTNLQRVLKALNSDDEKVGKKIVYADIADLAGSPALKRGIWQAVKVVEDLVRIFGEPEHLMIEVAREEGTKKRTQSRVKKIEALLKGIEKDEKELANQLMRKIQGNEQRIQKDKRFYLYFMQKAKCAYSNTKLELSDLHLYEIDHILPQSFIKDDSFDNLVLVKKSRNQEKSGYKVPLDVIANSGVKMMWRQWYEQGFISKIKLERLEKAEITEADKQRFIARQLVETRQIIKNVGTLFEERFTNTSVHLVKAPIVTKFRKALELPKDRTLNNKHHAVDALLATLLIQHVVQKYGHNLFEFSIFNNEISKKITKQAQNHKGFFIFTSFLSEKIEWANQLISAKSYVDKLHDEVPWNTTKKIGNNDNLFYNETIYSPKVKEAEYESEKNQRFVHSSLTVSKTFAIHYVERKKKGDVEHQAFVKITVLEEKQLQSMTNDEKALYLIRRDQPKKTIITANYITAIPKYQKIEWNGEPYYWASLGELHIGKQFVLSKALVDTIESFTTETEVEVLQDMYECIAREMFQQYPIFTQGKMPEKVEKLKAEIITYADFVNGYNEIKKAAAANGSRSDLLGSRLTKTVPIHELKLVQESITGLQKRKPKRIVRANK